MSRHDDIRQRVHAIAGAVDAGTQLNFGGTEAQQAEASRKSEELKRVVLHNAISLAVDFLNDVARIADSLEKIATALNEPEAEPLLHQTKAQGSA